MTQIYLPEDVTQVHRRQAFSLTSNRCRFEGSPHSRVPLQAGPSRAVLGFPLLWVEVFSRWILPLSSSWALFTVKPACPYCRGVQGPAEALQSVCSLCPGLRSLYRSWWCMQTKRFAGENFSGGIVFLRACPFVPFPCFWGTRPSSKDVFTCPKLPGVSGSAKWQCQLQLQVEKG